VGVPCVSFTIFEQSNCFVIEGDSPMATPSGKVAIVTGCAHERGFGHAIARHLAAAGVNLVLVDVAESIVAASNNSWRGLATVAEEVERMGQVALTAIADVRSSGQVTEIVKRAIDRFGRLDILVNNAAAPSGADRVPVVDLPEAAWDVVIETNLKGTYLCAKAVAKTMLERGVRGRIINIASELGKIGAASKAAYCASKFGIIGFTQSLALELAPAGITVNAVCPGLADTNRIDYLGRRANGSYDPELRADELTKLASVIPLGRVATVDDVAAVVAFLASEAAQYITGEAINVSGGLVMC
jgi:NAD(P)-dependent dehydrogenase (short-subunit alcohol dehydrogenase family)